MMKLPRHVAIIMDGNGRWARRRMLPRIAGHQQGVESVRSIVSACVKRKIPFLTLFTFSSENWRRPKEEIDFLFELFLHLLKSEIKSLNENGVRLRAIGDHSGFSKEFQLAIVEAEDLTSANTGLQLNVAFNYGGRWDILQATQKIAEKIRTGEIQANDITESAFSKHLALADSPDPDLFIRTSGEYRISNFLLWQCAYTELFFSDVFWPDFREAQFEEALKAYASRQRRFGSADQVFDVVKPFLKPLEQPFHA